MALLEINQISKTYATGEVALRGVDMSLNGEEIVAVLGLSGSGKSTLLRCINRLVEPDSGTVTLDGVNITKLNKAALRKARRNMGMIFQEFNLVERLTVLENVLSGTLGSTGTLRSIIRAFKPEDIKRGIALCSRVGIIDQIHKRADQLSGGQRQRVGIARALIQQPKLLLVDEPTSSLDPKIGAEVMDLMSSISKEDKIPMLVSVHDVQLAKKYSDRIVGMQGGLKIFDDRTSTINSESLGKIYDMAS